MNKREKEKGSEWYRNHCMRFSKWRRDVKPPKIAPSRRIPMYTENLWWINIKAYRTATCVHAFQMIFIIFSEPQNNHNVHHLFFSATWLNSWKLSFAKMVHSEIREVFFNHISNKHEIFENENNTQPLQIHVIFTLYSLQLFIRVLNCVECQMWENRGEKRTWKKISIH